MALEAWVSANATLTDRLIRLAERRIPRPVALPTPDPTHGYFLYGDVGIEATPTRGVHQFDATEKVGQVTRGYRLGLTTLQEALVWGYLNGEIGRPYNPFSLLWADAAILVGGRDLFYHVHAARFDCVELMVAALRLIGIDLLADEGAGWPADAASPVVVEMWLMRHCEAIAG